MAMATKLINSRIENYIQSLIKSGQLKPGDRLPPERKIALRFKTSNTPVRQATRLFIKKGLLESKPGSGIFVRQDTLNRTRTNRIGFLFCHSQDSLLDSPYYSEIIAGIDKGANEYNRSLVWQNLVPESGNNYSEKIYSTMDIVDGFILVAPFQHAYSGIEETLLSMDKPAVVLEWEGATEKLNAVVFDGYAMGETAVQFLLSLGHKRIGYIRQGSRVDPGIKKGVLRRFQAYKNTLSEHGLPVDKGIIIDECFINQPEPIRELLTQPGRPTALFFNGSGLIPTIVRTARDLGIRIPEDLSIVAIDDTAENREYSITTIIKPLKRLGQEGTRRLLEVIEESRSGIRDIKRITLPSTLVKRGSHAAPTK